MRNIVAVLLAVFCLPCSGQVKTKLPSVKDCMNYINTASGIAAEYSGQPYSKQRLQVISSTEDKLIECANLPSADAKMLYSLFDVEVRLGGVKQIWLVATHN